jgi:hypothetical protein
MKLITVLRNDAEVPPGYAFAGARAEGAETAAGFLDAWLAQC